MEHKTKNQRRAENKRKREGTQLSSADYEAKTAQKQQDQIAYVMQKLRQASVDNPYVVARPHSSHLKLTCSDIAFPKISTSMFSYTMIPSFSVYSNSPPSIRVWAKPSTIPMSKI